MPLLGELAAIATALLFAVSSTLFTAAGRRAGAFAVNRSRLLVAALVAVLMHLITRGSALPVDLAAQAWLWLALSGFIGLAIGDDLLFRAFVRVGPAVSMLIFSMSPALAALFGWVALGETLSTAEILGATTTLCGIAWVVSERRATTSDPRPTIDRAGLLYAFGGALGQALGLVTAKLGLNHGADPQGANTIRLVSAFVAIWLVTALTRRTGEVFAQWKRSPEAVAPTVIAATLGPVIGVWLSLVAINLAPIGVASTLMSLTPLFLLPITRVVFGDPVTRRALVGTAVAVAGVAVLILGGG